MKRFNAFKPYLFHASEIKKYWAHDGESLIEHADKTTVCFLSLCENGLENIIDRQIIDSFNSNQDEVKRLILNLVRLHDIGKLNPAFQKAKLKRDVLPTWADPDSNHSEIGWHIFSLGFFDEIEKLQDDGDLAAAWILTTVIAGHHTYCWGMANRDSVSDHVPSESSLKRALEVANAAGWKIDEGRKSNSLISLWTHIGKYIKKVKNAQALFTLYKTIYSALILSDYIATGEQKTGTIHSIMSSITPGDVTRWRKAFSETEHMKQFRSQMSALTNLHPSKIGDINSLRNKILLETEEKLKKGLEQKKRIFYLEAPTGAGKTNCAVNLALSVLEHDTSLQRLFFVFPFINLIEQNVEVIRKSICAKEDDLLEVHSLAEWKMSEEVDYSTEYDQRTFLDGKINIISSVAFFEALGSSRKAQNYKICNLSNSIIVLDEIQSIDDTQWTYLKYLLESFANANNCYFILMSATLPRIDKILIPDEDKKLMPDQFIELLPDFEQYQKHPCFAKRTSVVIHEDITTSEQIVSLVENLVSGEPKPRKLLVVVNTIRRSQEVFQQLTKVKDERENIRYYESKDGRRFLLKLLNSELLPHKKREIIELVKKSETELILVSTQCIEAGVDADFDVGIRDFAVLDSIEQVAGRVNRENKKGQSALHIVKLSRSEVADACVIYGKSRRWNAMQRISIDKTLESRDYTEYYRKLTETINDKNSRPRTHDIPGRSEVIKALGLRLTALKEFKLIKDRPKRSIFLVMNIPKKFFSDEELKQIQSSVEGDDVIGQKIWNEYENIKLIRGREGMLRMAAFSSILAKFIVNRSGEANKPLEPIFEFKGIYDLDSGFLDSESIY